MLASCALRRPRAMSSEAAGGRCSQPSNMLHCSRRTRHSECVAKGSLGHGRGCCKRRPGGRHGRPGVRQRNWREWPFALAAGSRERRLVMATTRLQQGAPRSLPRHRALLALVAGKRSPASLIPSIWCPNGSSRGPWAAQRRAELRRSVGSSRQLGSALPNTRCLEARRCCTAGWHAKQPRVPSTFPGRSSSSCCPESPFAVRKGWLWRRKLSSPCVSVNDRAAGAARRGGPSW